MREREPSIWSLTARFIFPVDGPPLEAGIVVIKGDRLLAIERKNSRKADIELGNVAVIPGLVNAHTHLDLSGLRGRVAFTGNFTDWLRTVIQHRRTMKVDDVQSAFQAGINECLLTGTTLVGDISGMGLSWRALEAASLRAVVFYELLGLTKERATQAWAEAQTWLAVRQATPNCRPGLSPHAPYSVRASLFESAAHTSLPLSIHLAETQEELGLLKDHDGPFREFLLDMGVWDKHGLAKGVSEVIQMNAKVQNLLLIHGNYLDTQADLPPCSTVVYCPRTHAYFGHSPHPFRELLARGVRVALGTDSLASNPDLDLLEEVRFLSKNFPEVPAQTLLRMATLNGAAALGWDNETGSLTPGKSADLVVVPLPTEDRGDPHALLLDSTNGVKAVMFQGKWVLDSSVGGIS
jgi:cytosine/adenosine deaminase-related metal-dependent hydrolase